MKEIIVDITGTISEHPKYCETDESNCLWVGIEEYYCGLYRKTLEHGDTWHPLRLEICKKENK